LEFDKELVKVNRENSSFGESPNGIFTTSIGRWTQHLSDEETWWVQRINSAETKELRYQEMPTSPSRIRLFGDFLSLPFVLIRALIVNRERRGPTLQYLLKRLSR
jgi:hypothetical protein